MISGMLKYYMNIDSDTLTNEEFAREWEVLRRIRELEKEESFKNLNFSE